MVSLRTALLSCLTAVTCVAMLLAYLHTFMRYDIVGNENAVFVLDRQTTLMHRCDKDHCTLITPQGTTIDSMRKLAGIISPDEIIKKADQSAKNCNCQPEEKPFTLKPKIEITSFQTLDNQTSSVLTPNQIKASQESKAKDLGMSPMATPTSSVNPFPTDMSNSSNNQSQSLQSSPSSSYPSSMNVSYNPQDQGASSSPSSPSPSSGDSFNNNAGPSSSPSSPSPSSGDSFNNNAGPSSSASSPSPSSGDSFNNNVGPSGNVSTPTINT